MKKHIFLGAALLSLFAASCSNEDVINNDSELQEGQTISLQANITDGSGTRMTYEDDATNKVLKFSWSDSESFNLYKGTGSTASVFSKTANGNIFTGTIPGGGTDTYYAVYGNNITNNNGVLDVNIANQTGVASAENGITTFMLAEAKYLTQASGMTPSLDFQHKLGVMKLTITFSEDVTGTANKVTINGLHNKANYTLSDGSYAYTDEGKGDITVTNGETGFTIAGNKITAYVAVFPETISDNQVMITASVGNYDYAGTISAKTLAAGKVVPVNVTLVKRNFKSVYSATDYKTWSTDNCGSAPTYKQMKMYLGAGVYWDDGAEGDNQQTYTLPDGEIYHTGLWVMKKAYIDGFSAGSAKAVAKVSSSENPDCWHEDRPAATEIGKYFFLPATGYYYNGEKFSGKGYGHYWSSTQYQYYETNSFQLYFGNKSAIALTQPRVSGCLPMVAE